MSSFDKRAVQSRIGYAFDDPELLERAFTHASYINEHKGVANERLEFLGDSILDFLVGERLYIDNPTDDEGKLSEKRAALVSRKPLARIIDSLGLMKYLLIGAGVDKRNFSEKNRSDLFESILGAIYLDGGLDECRAFLDRNFYGKVVPEYDYKTQLQNRLIDAKLSAPTYATAASNGGFTATVHIGDKRFNGSGRSKHAAEISAAKSALESMFGKKDNKT